MKAIPVRWEAPDRRRSGKAVLLGVEDGKEPLPSVGDRLAAGIEGARPVVLAVAPAAGGELPLRFGRQIAPHPAGVSEGVLVSDVDDRMVLLARNRTPRPLRLAPVRAGDISPPLGEPAAASQVRGLDEDGGSRSEQRLRHS